MDNKYQNAKIYKIVSENSNQIYIGSTIQTLKERLRKHRSDCKKEKGNCTSFIIIRQGNYKIELIKDYPCNSKKELEREEGKYQIEMNCINKCIAGRGLKESCKAYYNKNKEELNMKTKKYHQEHKEELNMKSKKYHQEHKEELNIYINKYRQDNEMKLKQKFVCACGGKFTHQGKSHHFKTERHIKYLDIKK